MYRVLIADDEKIECKGLEWMLHRYFPELHILPCVYSGVQLMKAIEELEPDIVITDINMPGMNGLEVLDIMKLKKKKFSTILLSAYSEFEYAQKAVYLGVSNYLVKPVRPEVFAEAVRKVLQELQEREQNFRGVQKTEQMETEMQRLMETEILQGLILGEINPDRMEKFLKSSEITFHGGVVLTIREEGNRSGEENGSYVKLVEYLKKAGICMYKRYCDDLIVLFLPYDTLDCDNYKDWVGDILYTVFDSLGLKNVFCGISGWKEKLEELTDAVKESNVALYAAGTDPLCYFEHDTAPEGMSEFRESEKQFLELLSRKETENAVCFLEEWLDELEKKHVPAAAARLFVAELFMRGKQEKLLQDCRIQEENGGYGVYWRAVSLCQTIEELKKFVRQEAGRLEQRELSGKKVYHKYVEASLLYMESHYMEDLSLEQLAEKNSVSSFYLSRLFRQELGRSFVEILTDIRIREAVSLLRGSDYKVQEIGTRTGYQNAGHFFKVFKKHTGMTPGQMKKYLAAIS